MTISSTRGCGCVAKSSNIVTCKGRILIRASFYGCTMLAARSRGSRDIENLKLSKHYDQFAVRESITQHFLSEIV
jgi:hypothetical protein